MLGLRLDLPGAALLRVSGTAPSLPVTPAPTPTPTPTPAPPAIGSIVIEGDSITFAGGSGGFAHRYAAAPPSGKRATVHSQNSRVVAFAGTDQSGNALFFSDGDGQNSLVSHVTEDVTTHGGQLIASMIGANDLAVARTAAQYRSDLARYGAAVRDKGARFAWSPPLPYGTNQAHASYANFTAQRAALMATARDPATWGQFADYYLPLGEHPDFAAADNMTLVSTDGVHPTQAGQDALYPVFRAAMDSLLDASRATSTRMYAAAWPASGTSLATGTQVVRRFLVRGVAHVGLDGGVAVAGGGAEVRLNGGAWATGIARIYNGDTIDLRITTSHAHSTAVATDLTIGSETRTLSFTTGADVAPVGYAHGGIASLAAQAATHAFEGCTFAAAGIAVVALNGGVTGAGGSVTIGGVPATKRCATIANGTLEVWTAPIASGGAKDVVVVYGGFTGQSTVAWGVVTGAAGTPVTAGADRTGNASQPFLTPVLTVPANGLALGWFGEYAGPTMTAGTTNAGTTFVAEAHGAAFQGETLGLIVGRRPTSGSLSFDYAFGDFALGWLVFEAAA